MCPGHLPEDPKLVHDGHSRLYAIALSAGAGGTLVNEEQRGDIAELTRVSTPEANLRRIDAIFAAREQMLEFNVPPMLALESMMLALRVARRSA